MPEDRYFLIGCAVLLVLIVIRSIAYVLVMRDRRQQDHCEILEPILRMHGLRLISSRYPGLFKVGPFFTKFEIRRNGRTRVTGGIPVNYLAFRVLDVMDGAGRHHEIWARLEFRFCKLDQIRWRAVDKSGLPEGMLSLLEN